MPSDSYADLARAFEDMLEDFVELVGDSTRAMGIVDAVVDVFEPERSKVVPIYVFEDGETWSPSCYRVYVTRDQIKELKEDANLYDLVPNFTDCHV